MALSGGSTGTNELVRPNVPMVALEILSSIRLHMLACLGGDWGLVSLPVFKTGAPAKPGGWVRFPSASAPSPLPLWACGPGPRSWPRFPRPSISYGQLIGVNYEAVPDLDHGPRTCRGPDGHGRSKRDAPPRRAHGRGDLRPNPGRRKRTLRRSIGLIALRGRPDALHGKLLDGERD